MRMPLDNTLSTWPSLALPQGESIHAVIVRAVHGSTHFISLQRLCGFSFSSWNLARVFSVMASSTCIHLTYCR